MGDNHDYAACAGNYVLLMAGQAAYSSSLRNDIVFYESQTESTIATGCKEAAFLFALISSKLSFAD